MADETKKEKKEEFEDLDSKRDPKGGKKPTSDMEWFPHQIGSVEPKKQTD